MNKHIKYLPLDQVDTEQLLALVNEDSIRTHLIVHPIFDMENLNKWIEQKSSISRQTGCCIKAVYINDNLAGWCGIQPDNKGFELSIVIAKHYWGFGIKIYKDVAGWAREMGHKEILIHLLETRPEYAVLKKLSTKVEKTALLGRIFTTYTIPLT